MNAVLSHIGRPDLVQRMLAGGRPLVMGVLNVTPDSFSDGGRFVDSDRVDVARAVEHGLAMVAAGADLIDIGGESTRPGAPAVGEAEEIDRVVPVIAALTAAASVPISIDTSKAGVIAAALHAGASLVNDVRALQEPGALEVTASSGAAICLMHMQGAPRTMQHDPHYIDVVAEVRDFLAARVAVCEQAGIARDRIVIDPGIGFGKRLEHNLTLLANLPALRQLGLPVLIGASRKSMLGSLLGRGVEQRLAGSLALAMAAALGGASILRVHDVSETVDAVRAAAALRAAGFNI
jgi:dihydropteroate synthase